MDKLTNNEQKVFAYLLQNPKYITESISKLNEEKFLSKSSQTLFKLISAYYNKYNTTPSSDTFNTILTNALSKNKINNDTYTTLTSSIPELYGTAVVDTDFNYYIDNVIEDYKNNELKLAATAIISGKGSETFENILDNVKEHILNIDKSDSDGTAAEGSINDSADARLAAYEDVRDNPDKQQLISTGFSEIDSAIGGFSYENLIYVIGRKGDGKSVLLLNFAHALWVRGRNVILFSLEINKDDYERRFDARAALIPSGGLKLGKLSDENFTKYKNYLSNLKEGLGPAGQKVGTFYVVDIPGKCTPAIVKYKVEQVEQEIRNSKNQPDFKFDAVIIDYSQLMQPNEHFDQKRDALGAIALELKQFARESKKVVISAAQMNRVGKADGSTKNGQIGSEHMAESDQVSDHLDMGVSIRSISDDEGIIESFKTRDGAPFKFHFKKNFAMMNIIEIDKNEWNDVTSPDTQNSPMLGSNVKT